MRALDEDAQRAELKLRSSFNEIKNVAAKVRNLSVRLERRVEVDLEVPYTHVFEVGVCVLPDHKIEGQPGGEPVHHEAESRRGLLKLEVELFDVRNRNVEVVELEMHR